MFDVHGKEFKKSSCIRMNESARGKVLEVGKVLEMGRSDRQSAWRTKDIGS